MAQDALRQAVWRANMDVPAAGLAVLTWGNASAADREAGLVLIKPSGVAYDDLQPEDIVTVSLDTGETVAGEMCPSSDTPTHLALYRGFPGIGGVVHSHSTCAVGWAQAGREIPCLGTTHADHFAGPVPVTRQLTAAEIESDYEGRVGAVIVERFRVGGLDPDHVPAALVPGHGPFTWGATVQDALRNAIALEEVARMALQTVALRPDVAPLPEPLLNKHFRRKHGPDAYYGQQEV
ncbi:MAG: L-ribulose-5-phosphate 4-epimerase AraD [Candidatus Brocadiia bacterium]